ncbi:MAG: NERD domain-containing protein [Lachnospiraceae bacterium]|nr:NERD domain-containing protein [Lachnospiraceae bacterium]
MGLFDKLKNPVFIKDDSEAERQLAALQELKKNATGKLLEQLEQEISKVESGIVGEKQVRFELENSHIPMYVLHDLFLEHDGLTAQIDYLVITRKSNYVIECKNLYGNIEINNNGSFIRTYKFGNKVSKEGIYSPITQNQRHMELIKAIRAQSKGNILTKALFEKKFYNNYHSIVVLANPKQC